MSISGFVAVVNNLLRGITEMVRILNLLLPWMKKKRIYTGIRLSEFYHIFLISKTLIDYYQPKDLFLMTAANPGQHKKTVPPHS